MFIYQGRVDSATSFANLENTFKVDYQMSIIEKLFVFCHTMRQIKFLLTQESITWLNKSLLIFIAFKIIQINLVNIKDTFYTDLGF